MFGEGCLAGVIFFTPLQRAPLCTEFHQVHNI